VEQDNAIFADVRLRRSRAVSYKFEMFSCAHNSKTVPPREKVSRTNIDALRQGIVWKWNYGAASERWCISVDLRKFLIFNPKIF